MRIPEETIENPTSLSLVPYTGPWTSAEAAHLLRRTMVGPTFAQIQQAVTDGLDATMTQLMTLPTPTYPLTYLPEEAVAAQGTTWVNSVYPATNPQATDGARQSSMMAWMMERLNQPTVSIQEKICLFWENHFGVEATSDTRATYNLQDLFRTSCLGDFRQLVKDVTVDPNMLIFLNGATNNVYSPNENYAREVLELFTVGKGEQVGPGDYSNYTEEDIRQASKILTGWTINGFMSTTETSPTAVYYTALHDTTTKTLSAYFGNAVISNADALEYANFIDIVFQQPNMARFICRKLYRWFVNYDLTQDVEDTVIAELALTLETNNFMIQPVLEELLRSEHFYDLAVRGAIIKNPLEFMFSIVNSTDSRPNYSYTGNYPIYLNMYYVGSLLGMEYLRPPNVGGWTAYYQAPSFTKLWCNSSFIKLRFDIGAYMTIQPGINVNGYSFKVNALAFLDGLSLPGDAPQVIDDLVTVFCPKGLSAAQKLLLKGVLTNGQPDFEWTIQYNDYAADPTNPTVSNPVRVRVENVLYRVFQSPEFQTI